ncbi:hypothetical protein ACL9RL_09380 [Plantibacter sp. Mn2098]|uniref:hypothetical protein n=1 Tax=Plantibacter sp. Mn2098 TaxID=3395266 RepID=UPI003BC84184
MTITTDMPCVNRCVRKGTETNDEPELLVARHGEFCHRCFTRTFRALDRVPALVQHIVSNFPTSITKAPNDIRVSGTGGGPTVPFNEQAWVDADKLYSLMVTYAQVWATALAVSPPAPARRSWRDEHGYVIGLPANETPTTARRNVGVMSDWLKITLEEIFRCDAESVNRFSEALAEVGEIAGKWPTEERPRTSVMPHVQISFCGGEIKYWPAGSQGTDTHAVCTACSYEFDLDEYEDAVTTYLAEKQEAARMAKAEAAAATRAANRSDVVRRHLLGKYGEIVGSPS